MNPIYEVLPNFAQNLAWTWAGYRRSRSQLTADFYRTLERLECTIDEPLEAHRQRQWETLKAIIDLARNHVPYYRFLPPVVDTGDPAESIEATLRQIPPLEKSVYRARSRDFVVDNIPERDLGHFSTSGTTGTALPVWHGPDKTAEYDAVVWRQYRSFGVDLNDPWISFGGRVIVPLRRQKPPFWRVDYLGKRTLFSIFHMSPANLPSYVDAIHDTEFRYVQGYPSALHLVARAMLEAGRPLAPGRVAGVFTSSESLLSFQRESIEKAFGATVRDHYSATERAVSMTACAENMLHVDMEFGIVEVEPTEQTEEHVRGSLLVTGLGNPATLFIRYRIGDVGTLSRKPCRCGRPGDVFLDIDGRIEDYVMTPDGALVGRLDHVFKQRYEVAEAQILQQEKSSVEVLVVPARGFDAESSRDLRKAIQARLGPAMNVEIRLVESIPREANGKLRAVRSKIARLQA